MSDPQDITYATYRGAGHVPMLVGIPLIPCLSLFGSFIASFFLFIMILEWVALGVVICAVILMLAVWLHFECTFESRALEIRLLEIKGLFLRLKKGVRVLEITSMKQTREKEEENVQRFVKEKLGIQ